MLQRDSRPSTPNDDRPAQSPADLALGPSDRVASPKERMRFPRRFSKPGVHPFDEVEWELRDAVISSSKGEVAFEQRNVEVPKFWSQLATNVVAQKYFRGQLGTPERETSVRQLLGRVVMTAGRWGREGNYFAGEEDAQVFEVLE